MSRKLPVFLGADPFSAHIEGVIAVAEVDENTITIAVDREKLVKVSRDLCLPHIKEGDELTRLDQILGLALNVAYKSDKPKETPA